MLAIAYVAFAAAVWGLADRWLFLPPPRGGEEEPGLLRIPVGAADTLSALWLPHPSARYAILYSHGNAEDLRDVRFVAERLRREGFSVLAYDYRGYGRSTGRPSTRAAMEDVRAAYDHLTGPLGVAPARVIAYGRSLGGGVTVPLAASVPVGGVVLESTFTSAFRTVVPFPVLPFDRMASAPRMSRISAPVLVIHGTEDAVVPPAHGRRLLELAPGPKRALWVDGAGHDDVHLLAGPRLGAALRALAATIDTTPRTSLLDIPMEGRP